MRMILFYTTVLLCFGLQSAVNASDSSPYQLAYISHTDNQIWTINPDGTDAKSISDGVTKQNLLASPDGRYLAYGVQRFYDSVNYLTYQVIIILDRTTSEKRPVTGEETIENLTWSPDSQQLLFSTVRHDQNANMHYKVYVINRDGSGRSKIADMIGYALTLSWSPDGKHILLSRQNTEAAYQILTMNIDGSGQREVTHIDSCFICDRPRWTPDSQHIVFYRHPDLFMIDADGQHQRQLTDFVEVYNVVDVAYNRYGVPGYSFSADSQTLYYTMGYPIQIVKLSLAPDGWANRTVLYDFNAHIIGDNQLSPDGKLLFFGVDSAEGNVLSSLDLNTHEVHVLAKHVSQPVLIAAN